MTEDDTGSRGGSDGNGGEHDSRKCGMASTRAVAYGEAQANVLWELAALSRRLRTSGESERSSRCVSMIGASNS